MTNALYVKDGTINMLTLMFNMKSSVNLTFVSIDDIISLIGDDTYGLLG